MQPSQGIDSLEDLLKSIEHQEGRKRSAMYRPTGAHISMCFGRPAHLIALKELPGLHKQFSGYLHEKHEKGECTRNTTRSYINYFRILLKKARKHGFGECSPGVEKLWTGIRAVISREYGSRDIMQDAIEKGTVPKDYTEQHLDSWCEQQARRGRHPAYIRARVRAFRKRIPEAGLSHQLPKLSFSGRKPNYGVPFEKFPEPLKTHVASLLAWKQAPYVRGRPNRYRCRPITVHGLKQLFYEIAGFSQLVLGRTPQTLNDLVCEEIVSRFVEWRLVERGVDPQTVVDDLRMIPPLGRHPLFKGTGLQVGTRYYFGPTSPHRYQGQGAQAAQVRTIYYLVQGSRSAYEEGKSDN